MAGGPTTQNEDDFISTLLLSEPSTSPMTGPQAANSARAAITHRTSQSTLTHLALPHHSSAGGLPMTPRSAAAGSAMTPIPKGDSSQSIHESEFVSFPSDSPTKIRPLPERSWQIKQSMRRMASNDKNDPQPIIGSAIATARTAVKERVSFSEYDMPMILSRLGSALNIPHKIRQKAIKKDGFLESVKMLALCLVAIGGAVVITAFTYSQEMSWGSCISASLFLLNVLTTMIITLQVINEVPSTYENDKKQIVKEFATSVLEKVCQKRSLYIPLVTQMADSATDLGMMVGFYFKANQNEHLPGGTSYKSLFWASLSALIFHRIFSTVIVFDRTGRRRDILLQLIDCKIYEVIRISWEYGESEPSCLQNQIFFFEAILESAPQAVIGLYVLIQTGATSPLLWASTVSSVVFLAMQIFTMDKGNFTDESGGTEMDINFEGNFMECCLGDERGQEKGKEHKSDDEDDEGDGSDEEWNSEMVSLTPRSSGAAAFDSTRSLSLGGVRRSEKFCWMNANWLVHLLWRMIEVTWSISMITCVWVVLGGFWVFICFAVLSLPFFAELVQTGLYWCRTEEPFFFHSFVALRSILATDLVEITFIDQDRNMSYRCTPLIRILTILSLCTGNIFIPHPRLPFGMFWMIEILGFVSVFLYFYLGMRKFFVGRHGSRPHRTCYPLCGLFRLCNWQSVEDNWYENPIGFNSDGGLITMKSVRTLEDLMQLHRYTFNMDASRLNWFKLDEPIEICVYLKNECKRENFEWAGTQGENKFSFLQAVFRYSDLSKYSETVLELWLLWMTREDGVGIDINWESDGATKSAFLLACRFQKQSSTLIRLLFHKFGGILPNVEGLPKAVSIDILSGTLVKLGREEKEAEAEAETETETETDVKEENDDEEDEDEDEEEKVEIL